MVSKIHPFCEKKGRNGLVRNPIYEIDSISTGDLVENLREEMRRLRRLRNVNLEEAFHSVVYIYGAVRRASIHNETAIYDLIVEVKLLELYRNILETHCYEICEKKNAQLCERMNFLVAAVRLGSFASAKLCEDLLNIGVHEVYMTYLTGCQLNITAKDSTYSDICSSFLGTLHNLLRSIRSARDALRSVGAVEMCQKFKSIPILNSIAVLTQAHMLTEEENSRFNDADSTFETLLALLDSAKECADSAKEDADSDTPTKGDVVVLEPAMKCRANDTPMNGGLSEVTPKGRDMAGASIIRFPVDRWQAICASEVLDAINKFAELDANKPRLINAGVIRYYSAFLNRELKYSPQEIVKAIRGIYVLGSNCKEEILKNVGCKQALKNLCCDLNENIRKEARKALLVIDENASLTSNENDTVDQHIFISFHSHSKVTALNVRDYLKDVGIQTQISDDNKNGSFLEFSASAIEKASIVIIGLSRKYKDCVNCKTEAEYAFSTNKPLIPVCLETGYKPDGWLGMLVAGKLYFEVNSPDQFEASLHKLVQEIRKIRFPEKNITDHRIFISYQWDSKDTVLKVKERLTLSGLKTWIDKDDMSGSIINAVATAIEKASVVIICLSEKYDKSHICKLEAKYAFELKKRIITLSLEKNYKSDGWLRMLSSSELSFDFSLSSKFEKSVTDLINQLKTLDG